jgi:hypothetical protein
MGVDFVVELEVKAMQIGANPEAFHIFHSRTLYFSPCSRSVVNVGAAESPSLPVVSPK